MPSVFVIRPFTASRQIGNSVDFDRVQEELIDPAIRGFGLENLAERIMLRGPIQFTPLDALARADIVISDISVLDVQVFSELGLYALRCANNGSL
jgi:hypothetical protein